MRSGSPSPHFGGDPNRFHYFLRRRSLPHGVGGVRTDAIRALGDVGNSHRDQLLRTRGKRALGEYTAAEGTKGSRRPGSQAGSLFSELACGKRIEVLVFRHWCFPSWCELPRSRSAPIPSPCETVRFQRL